MKPTPPRLLSAQTELQRVAAGLSILGQIGEQLDLPIAPSLLEELTVLARAQRRVLRAAHRQLEADPLLAHLLSSRKSYRRADRYKSGKRQEEEVCRTYYLAQSLGYPGGIHDWRKLLAIFARS